MSRLLVISPVRNEASHIERVARALAAQTRVPDAWVVVDDGSVDDTPRILSRLTRELGFLQVAAVPSEVGDVPDRLAVAAEARAFNAGLHSVDWRGFTHVAKLDGDIELAPDYFEGLLETFAQDPRLGLAGGMLLEPGPGGWALDRVPLDYHVRGGLKCYSRACLEEIGGIEERLGWDTIDEVRARMRGFATRSIPGLVGRHHRPLATADGVLRGRLRDGRTFYLLHFPLPWVVLRSLKAAALTPRGLSGLAFLAGYLHAAVTRSPRVEDPGYRRWVRRELAHRARATLVASSGSR